MPPRFFPAVDASDANGLLAVGGELSPDWLLDAYRHAIFPWPAYGTLAWWSPDPRGILELHELHVSKRLARTIAAGRFEPSCDRQFAAVIHGCATAQGRRRGTWITQAMEAAYGRLHRMGHAHSVEVTLEGRLVGGVYGVTIGGLFAAESMFYHVRDASKVALYHLVRHLLARGYLLFDLQLLNSHTQTLGGTEIPRGEYLRRLAEAVDAPVSFGERLETP